MPASRNALIIASDTYADPELGRLRAPGNDAEALAGVLRDENIGQFDVQVSFNQHHYEVRAVLEKFFRDRSLEDVVLVHFSCRGRCSRCTGNPVRG
jgi:hypothetical protein